MPPISKTRRERGSGVFATCGTWRSRTSSSPGEKLSEVELAQRLGVSRTPVREALTRLVNDGFLLPASRGFVRKPLDVQETLDLYEARMAVDAPAWRWPSRVPPMADRGGRCLSRRQPAGGAGHTGRAAGGAR